ncbi:MAG TPA: thioredoxin domain-containing protein [Gammaproteobacteria bacterium]|nr:thioredoxin domain-containing protein [Gammaproteobacteria bacterium]
MQKVGVAVVSMILATGVTAFSLAKNKPVVDQSQMESVVENYINNHPEAIFQALVKYRGIQEEKALDATKNKALSMKDELFYKSGDPSMGNNNAPITIVEFMDYQCGYCKLMDSPLKEMVNNNPDKYRVVVKPVPFFGENSQVAATVAMAASSASKFEAVHQALLQLKKPYKKEDMINILSKNGVKLNAKNFSSNVDATIQLARALEVDSTPWFFVHRKGSDQVHIIKGAMPAEAFKQKIQNLTK